MWRNKTWPAALVLSALLAIAPTGMARAGDWSNYVNARYAYAIDIPPGFAAIAEAGNGDGGTAQSSDGRAKLSVWGGYMMADSFAAEIAPRIEQDRQEGWNVTYDRHAEDWASWSGSRDIRIFYQRSLLGCEGAAIHFRLEYDAGQRKAYDPIVARLVKSLQPEC
jgi:hypothetical protein